MTEREVQQRIIAYLRNTGWTVTVTAAGQRTRKQLKGLPDLYATKRGYGSLWVEVKAPGGKVNDKQSRWMAETRAAGVPCIVADSVDAVETVLRHMGD